MNLIDKILVLVGSVISIGFGIWHFTVPETWKWHSYIAPTATELLLAVQAINVFFSLTLVLFGAVNLLFIYGNKANNYSLSVILGATSILWITRVVLQIVYPQGSINPVLQYGMLSTFVVVTLSYLYPLTSLVLRETRKTRTQR